MAITDHVSWAYAQSSWSVTITADNAAATIQRPAAPGQAHYITSVSGSFSASQAAAKLMTLKEGTTVVGNFHVSSQRDVVFTQPIKLATGALAELSLAASGTAGQIGAVTLTGFTV